MLKKELRTNQEGLLSLFKYVHLLALIFDVVYDKYNMTIVGVKQIG